MRLKKFQSTRPRGRTRPYSCLIYNDVLCFNPRVLAGGRDFVQYLLPLYIEVSIHASSREDATARFRRHRDMRCFNPRVLAGGRDL